jgi:plasmid stabilization system protein ParE
MAVEVAWSPEAIEDIESIASYIERDSPFYAKAVVQKIVDLGRTLPRFPEMGRVVPELEDPAIRERFAYSFRVIYRIEADRILVIAVIHGRRLLDSVGGRFG